MQVQQQITQQQSLNLIQNIIKSTIGSIAYIRNLFEDDQFETKGLDGIAVKVDAVSSYLINRYYLCVY